MTETVRYRDRTRDYYRALGYPSDYVWLRFDTVPFALLGKPLSETTIGLVTTASPPDLGNRDASGKRQVWSDAISPAPTRLFTDNLAWDKDSTHTDDRASFLPIEAVQHWTAEGLVGGVATRFPRCPHRVQPAQDDGDRCAAGPGKRHCCRRFDPYATKP